MKAGIFNPRLHAQGFENALHHRRNKNSSKELLYNDLVIRVYDREEAGFG
jgi:hypothetical protein